VHEPPTSTSRNQALKVWRDKFPLFLLQNLIESKLPYTSLVELLFLLVRISI
jgi:hypothetical protein